MSTARARGALNGVAAANVAPPGEPASSSPATAGTRTSTRTRRAPLAFGEVNTRTASSSSSAAKSSTGKLVTSASTTPTSGAVAKKAAAVPPAPPPVVEDKENDPLPTSRKRARPQQQPRQIRQPSVDSLAELEASYMDDSRVSTAVIPADSSLVQTADAPAHSTPIASPALAPAVAPKDEQGKQANKRTPFQSLLDEEMLSETEGQLASAKPSGSDESEEAKTRRQLTENKLERVRSFVGSSGQHRGSSLAPPPIEDYREASDERRSKTAGTSEGDQEDEFGFYTVLKKSAANRAKQSRGVVPGPSSERVQFEERKKSASPHEAEHDEGSSLASFHPAQPASQVSSHADQDSLQALLRSSPSDLARPADKEQIAFSDDDDDDDSLDTDDYLYAPHVPRGDKKKPRKKPRRPNPRKGPRVADALERASVAKTTGKGKSKSGVASAATATAATVAVTAKTSTGKKGSSAQARKGAGVVVQSKAASRKKQAEQTLPSEEEEDQEEQGSDPSPPPTPEVLASGKRSRRSAQNSKSVPVPLTAAAAAATSASASKPLGNSAAGNVKKTARPKAKPVVKAGRQKPRGAKRRQEEDEEDDDKGEEDSSGEEEVEDDNQGAPLKAKDKGGEKRLKMYDELDDYALGEEWVI